MSSSYNYEKALSLEWNGQVYVLTVRNETPLGGVNYLYSSDGQSWYSSYDLSGSKLLTQANPYNVKWTGTNYAMIGNVANTSGNTILRGGPAATKFSALSLAGQGTNAPLYDLEANLEFPHTITFPRNTTLALGGAAADTTKIAFSLDGGITWKASYNSSTVFSVTANNAVWNGKLWVAVGQGGNTIATSTDGNVWVGRGSYIFSVAGQGVAWSPQLALWVAAGQGANSLAYSSDGIYWIGLGTSILGSAADVQWNGTVWVAIGSPNANNKTLAYSYDGKNWSNPPQTNLFDLSGTKTAWNGYFWTAVGVSSPANNLYNMGTSIDGIYWYMQKNANFSSNITNIYSNPAVTNETLFTTFGTPPAAPNNLVATSSTTSTISFTFNAPSQSSLPVNSMLTNCLFWFDAATSNSYTLGSSNIVASLVDKTGFGLINTSMRQFKNSTGTPAATLASSYVNGLSAININNTGFLGSLTTAYTGIRMSFYYVVIVVTSNNSTYGRILSMGQGGATGISAITDYTSITTFSVPLQSNTAPPAFTNIRNNLPGTYYAFVANTANIISGHFDGANIYTFLNGTSVGANSASVGAFNVNNFGIGVDTFTNTGTFVDNIYLAETLVYTSSPGTYQRQMMEGYLANKWGITSSLPAGHPYKSAAPIPSVSMTLLQNCVLWLDAADATSYTTSGSNVTQWNDKSGAGNNATQSTTASQATTGTTLNGLNIMNFTGTRYMQNTTMIFPNAPYTIFAVGYTSTNGYGRLLAGYPDAYLFLGTGSGNTQLATFVGNGGWTDTNTDAPGTSVASACIMCMTNNGTTTGLIPYVNGVTLTAKSGTCNSFTGFYIGTSGGGGQPWAGYIAEIMVYNYILSTPQRQYVEGYLAGKWGLQGSLPSLHPYKSTAPSTAAISNVNPTITANCIMWLDGADTSTLLLSGSNVLQWNDKSGNNNNASQSNATYQFTWNSNVQNSKGALYTGTGVGYMTVPNIAVPVTNTIFIVAYTTVASPSSGCAISSASDIQMRLNATTASSWINLGNSSSWYTASSIYGVGSMTIISWTENSTSAVIYGNGNKGGSNTGSFVGYTGIVLGSNNFVTQAASTSQPWLGYIAEVLVYNRVIPNAQRQYIEGYLANKWGLKSGLPANHPYYSATLPPNGIALNNINTNVLQNCLLWLDAADTNTLILSGANLLQWNDKSGNNNNATKFDTGTGQPTYGATNFNNLPGIQMNTGQGFYAPMTSGITTNGISVFAVFIKNGANNTYETIFNRTSSNIAAPIDLYQTTRLYGTGAGTNASFASSFNIQTATSATLFNIVVSNTNWSEWVNGTLSSSNTTTALFDNSSYFYIGTRADHVTQFTGVIAEILVYNSAMPIAQRQYIEGYLAWKWNLQSNLPSSHPYYSAGPTISTITAISTSSSYSVGSTPTAYTVAAVPATGSNVVQTVAYGATSGTVTGLTSATSYNLSMVSTNSYGSSAPTNTVTYQTQLLPPTNLTFVSYTTTSITFSFTPPVLGQGVVITSYTATAVPVSGSTVTLTGISPSATSATITSLVASTQYTITMVAINSYGTSATSTSLVYQTLLATPAPIVFVSATTTSDTFSFTPITLGTSVVATYTATLVPTSGTTVTQTDIISSPVTVNGLVNGMNYTVTLVATNSYSTSASSTGVVVQPLLVAPTNLATTSFTTTSINFSFTPPPVGTITSYTATATPTAPAGSPVVTLTGISNSATSANITGLVASTQYSVTLVAISAYGTSAASVALVQQTVLGPPTGLLGRVSDLSSITFSYVAPILGTGVTVNSYTATVSASGSTITVPNITSSPVTVSGLTYPVTYTISMVAINSISTSVSSTALTYTTSAYAQLTSFKPSPDISGTSVYNSTNYSVYVFRTTGTTYDISYTCASPAQMYVLAVGGGGGGGASGGGGGGAGGVVMMPVTIPGSASNQRITISVGTGGAGVANGNNGGNGVATSVTFPAGSVPSSIVASGGGGGGCNGVVGYTGGSGGGSGHQYTSLQTNSYSNNYNFGNAGGYSTSSNNGAGGGGGGAGIAGNNSYATAGYGSAGGNGIQCFLPGIATFSPSGTAYSTYYWAGGGGGSANCGASPSRNGGGLGGGGGGSNNGAGTAGVGGGSALNSGANGAVSNGTAGAAGANTGGGGGGSYTGTSGAGGSGIVVIALPNSAIISSYQAVLTTTQISNTGFFDTLSMRGLTTAAYNSLRGAYHSVLLNYNYFGPTMTLRYTTDVSGIYTQNFYADVYGNLWTQYGNTGTPLLQWLYTTGGSQTYAYVTKWYDQGMDTSFNCATQYNTTLQPVYDTSNILINFGYTSGGVIAPSNWSSNTGNAYFSLPSTALPLGDSSYTVTAKLLAMSTAANVNIISGGANSTGNTLGLAYNFHGSGGGYYHDWFATAAAPITTTVYTLPETITYRYATTGSTSTNYIYVNVNNGTTASALPGGLRNTTAGNCYLGNNLNGVAASYATPLNSQLYTLYVFNSYLSDTDRQLIEATNTSAVTALTITMTGYSSTTLAGNLPLVTFASSYVCYVNGVAVTPATNTVSNNVVYLTFTGLSNTSYTTTVLTVYIYNSVGGLIAVASNPQMTAPTAITGLAYSSVFPTSFVITWSGGVGYATTISYTLGGVPTTPSSSGVGTATFTGSFAYPLVVSVTATNFLTSATSSTSITTAGFSSVSITNIMGNDNNTTYTTNGTTYYISTLTRTDASYIVSYTTASSTLMYVLAVGGGGGAGSYDGGGGGGGGVVITPVLIPSGSGTVTVSIGKGGTGSLSGGTGTSGGTTFIRFSTASGSNITAFGGQGDLGQYSNGGYAGYLLNGTNNAYLNFAYAGGGGVSPAGGGFTGGGGGGAGTPYISNTIYSTSAVANVTFNAGGGNGIQCLLAPIANYTPTSKNILSYYYWGGGGGGGINQGGVTYINNNGGLGGGGGGSGSYGGTAGAYGYNAGVSGTVGVGNDGGSAGANTGSGGGSSCVGNNGSGGSGFVALAFPQTSQSYLVTNYNFTSPAVSGSNTVTLNPATVTGWTLTGTGSGSSNLVNNTTGVTGTYGNYMIGTGSNGYTYASPYVTCFLVQFYNKSSNSFSITSTPFFMAARTYSVSFITATRSIFDASNIMTVSLAGGSVSTSTTFTTSNILNPWKPLAFTCTPATAGYYSLTVTWSTTNVNDTTMAISQILVV